MPISTLTAVYLFNLAAPWSHEVGRVEYDFKASFVLKLYQLFQIFYLYSSKSDSLFCYAPYFFNWLNPLLCNNV